MSNSLCPDCHSKNTYSYLNNRKCGDCDKTWLDKLDDNETVGGDSRERAMRIVSQKVNSSSITSKFTSLDRDVALKKKTNSPEVRIPKKSSKLAHIKQLLKKNDTTEEGTFKIPVLDFKETSDDDDSIGTSGVDTVTSSIGKHFPKSLGSPMVDTFSQHQEPEKTPDRETELETESEAEAKPEPAPAPVEQKAFTFVTQKIRGAAIDSKWGRRVNLSSDDFMAPPSGATRKRARKDYSDTITDIGNTSTAHMTDDGALPEMLPQPNLDSQPNNQHPQTMPNNIISGNNETSEPVLERRKTRFNSNDAARKSTISSATMEYEDAQKSNKKKRQILDDAEYSADEYEYSGDDGDDDDSSFYDSDENTNKISSNNVNMEKVIPYQPRKQQQAQPEAGLSDSDDPFSDQENESEELIDAPKFTSNISKARAVNKKDNPYLNFFKVESEKIQAESATKLTYHEVQEIVSEKYRALSNEEKLALGKTPTQIKRQNYLYSKKIPRPKKPSRPKHVIEQEKSKKKQGYKAKNAYMGRIKF